jgi:large subunit ribosomal protein L21
MYAICRIAGQQYRVEPESKIKVPLLDVPEGETVEFEELLLISDGEKAEVGTPIVKGKVIATVLKHGKYPTILGFKRKRRKDYRKKQGHRQKFTELMVDRIER